jgi:enamine deaminase RidA (YjgF/YER057c/UK114 family)
MKLEDKASEACVRQIALPGADMVLVRRNALDEAFVSVALQPGESVETMFRRVAALLGEYSMRVVSQEVFGVSNQGVTGGSQVRTALGEVTWPITWVEPGGEAERALAGTQVWAVSGVAAKPLEMNGAIIGSRLDDGSAQYLRLGGITSEHRLISRAEQARAVFEKMEGALHEVGMTFNDVVRTWFYNDDVAPWYPDFNRVRTTFFRERRLLDGLLPASTGVGVRNGARGVVTGGLLAVKAKSDAVRRMAWSSPLQPSAVEYGSSFSRVVELTFPDHRRVLVSGTASIDPDGRSARLGDVAGQMAVTMQVVRVILQSRGMDWGDVSRGIAYFKRPEDVPEFEDYCERQGPANLPVLRVKADICRDELLFEIEVDAIRVIGGGARG